MVITYYTRCARHLLHGKHRDGNPAPAIRCEAYQVWSSWQLHWYVPEDHSLLWVVNIHRRVTSQTLKRKYHKRSDPEIDGGHLQKCWCLDPFRRIHHFGRLMLEPVATYLGVGEGPGLCTSTHNNEWSSGTHQCSC